MKNILLSKGINNYLVYEYYGLIERNLCKYIDPYLIFAGRAATASRSCTRYYLEIRSSPLSDFGLLIFAKSDSKNVALDILVVPVYFTALVCSSPYFF
jgi:hypothetical protein